MFFTNQENFRCQYTLTACTQCSDFNNSTLSSDHHKYSHVPGRNNAVHGSKETYPYITPTHSLQCYITKFSSTPMFWRTTFRSKYIFGYGKAKHDKYIIYEFLHMATLGATLEWESATTLGQHTLSSSMTTLQTHGQGHSTHYTLLPEESTADTDSIWTLFSHTGAYVMAIGSLIPAGLGIFCCYFFWCKPARLAHWPLQPGTIQYTIADDDIEAAPIYRCNGKASQPARPYENHDQYMECIPTWTESWCRQQMQSLVVPAQGSLANMSKIQGTQKCT